MAKYTLCVNNRYFGVDIGDNEFLKFLEENSQNDFTQECVGEKELLFAYVKKTSELYEKEQQIKKLLERLELNLSKD